MNNFELIIILILSVNFLKIKGRKLNNDRFTEGISDDNNLQMPVTEDDSENFSNKIEELNKKLEKNIQHFKKLYKLFERLMALKKYADEVDSYLQLAKNSSTQPGPQGPPGTPVQLRSLPSKIQPTVTTQVIVETIPEPKGPPGTKVKLRQSPKLDL
uniref:Uncharacterized protein n=2 Tax=Strongyloides stercoralis TaxID=6248 RepID=A0A0K0EC98_STRER